MDDRSPLKIDDIGLLNQALDVIIDYFLSQCELQDEHSHKASLAKIARARNNGSKNVAGKGPPPLSFRAAQDPSEFES